MIKQFSSHWNGSKQPRKQRKFVAQAHTKIRQGLMSAHLSKDLRTKYTRRSFSLRKGDTVKVMRGEFTGKVGKVAAVNLTKLRLTIEGLQVQKKDGTKINAVFTPSNLMITELNMEDKKREESIKKIVKTEAKK
jgi:large subunit ribosomal protein L24